MTKTVNTRTPDYEIDDLFLERWSPRALSSKKIEEEKIMKLFEAARWAPSCFNEQPWLFLYAQKEEDLKLFRSILVEKNQTWANNAPVLAFIFAKNNFLYNQKSNRWSQFDAGAAWMSLALEATKLGLFTHGMAGFNEEKAYELLNISKDEYTAMAAIAIGYIGDKSELPEDLATRDIPSERRPVSSFAIQGKYK